VRTDMRWRWIIGLSVTRNTPQSHGRKANLSYTAISHFNRVSVRHGSGRALVRRPAPVPIDNGSHADALDLPIRFDCSLLASALQLFERLFRSNLLK